MAKIAIKVYNSTVRSNEKILLVLQQSDVWAYFCLIIYIMLSKRKENAPVPKKIAYFFLML